MNEVSAKFDKSHGRDCRSFLVMREFVDPLATRTLNTTFNVIWAKEEFLNFRCCEFVIVPNSKVCQGQDALAIGGDFGNTFLLGDHMHSPTCLGGIIRNASNMPKYLVHFGCTVATWEKSRPVVGGGGTSSTDR